MISNRMHKRRMYNVLFTVFTRIHKPKTINVNLKHFYT